MAALVARLTDRRTALLATLAASFSWTMLYHGIYGRMYSLFLFTATLSLLLLLRALERNSRGRWAAWAAATLALLATQPYGVLVLVAEAVYVAVLRIRRPLPLRSALIALAAVLVLAGPLWRTYALLASRFEVGLGERSSELGSPLDVVDYLWDVFGDFTAGAPLVSVPIALVAGLGLVVISRTRPESTLLVGAVVLVPTSRSLQPAPALASRSRRGTSSSSSPSRAWRSRPGCCASARRPAGRARGSSRPSSGSCSRRNRLGARRPRVALHRRAGRARSRPGGGG